jgi:hypothetical protein
MMCCRRSLGILVGLFFIAAPVTEVVAFVPTSFETAAKEAPGAVVVRYHWRPLWLSYFEVTKTLKGPVAPGTTIWAFRQPFLGSERKSGFTYLLLLDESGDVYSGRNACGTYNLLQLSNDEVAEGSEADERAVERKIRAWETWYEGSASAASPEK